MLVEAAPPGDLAGTGLAGQGPTPDGPAPACPPNGTATPAAEVRLATLRHVPSIGEQPGHTNIC